MSIWKSWRSQIVEGSLIFAAWTAFFALRLGGLVLDPDRGEHSVEAAQMLAWASEYAMWALLTPVIFWLCRHLGRDGHFRPWHRVLAHVTAGLTIAVFMDAYTDLIYRFVFELRDPVASVVASLHGSLADALALNFLVEMILYMTILAIGFARAYYMRLQERRIQASELRAQLTEARLQALRMQINPHFLFNTLNAVAGLVEHDPKGVRTMVARLSALLRHTLDSSGGAEVPLSEELSVLDDYLAIMHVRFDDRLRVEKDIDEDTLGALVPDLLLQPLVENAIKHGISQREMPGTVRIAARRTGPYLRLSVEDDGDGRGRTGMPDPSGGIGLQNVRERLDRLYGDDHRMSFRPVPSGGIAAQIWIPYHETSIAPADAKGDGKSGDARKKEEDNVEFRVASFE